MPKQNNNSQHMSKTEVNRIIKFGYIGKPAPQYPVKRVTDRQITDPWTAYPNKTKTPKQSQPKGMPKHGNSMLEW